MINSKSSDREIVDNILGNFRRITGVQIFDVFHPIPANWDGESDIDTPMFNDEIIDKTANCVKAYLARAGIDKMRIGEIVYVLDDEIVARYHSEYIKGCKKRMQRNKNEVRPLSGDMHNLVAKFAMQGWKTNILKPTDVIMSYQFTYEKGKQYAVPVYEVRLVTKGNLFRAICIHYKDVNDKHNGVKPVQIGEWKTMKGAVEGVSKAVIKHQKERYPSPYSKIGIREY